MAGSFLKVTKVPGFLIKFYMHIPWYIKLFYRIQGNEPEKYIDRLYENSGYPAEDKEAVLKDMVHEFWFHGVQFDDYFLYDFYKKPEEYKRSFVNGTEAYSYWLRYNPHFKVKELLNKYNVYKTYGQYYNRKVIKCEKAEDFPAFLSMARELGKVVMKPIDGMQGMEIEIHDFNGASDEDVRMAFDNFLKKDGFLAEEFLHQHPALSAFNPSSVNTVRILTIVTGKPGDYDVKIFYPCMRIGRAGCVVDNPLSSGGLYCQVNEETGALAPVARGVDTLTYEACSRIGIKPKRWRASLR